MKVDSIFEKNFLKANHNYVKGYMKMWCVDSIFEKNFLKANHNLYFCLISAEKIILIIVSYINQDFMVNSSF